MSDEQWIDVTTVGDQWQVQLEIYSNRYRHRPLVFNYDKPSRSGFAETRYEEEWRAGRPPDGHHANTQAKLG